MKNLMKKVAGILAGIMVVTSCLFANSIGVMAAPELMATVQGTVSKGTTSEMLVLYNTTEGTYKIKIDSDTDVSRCKVLSVGKAVKVEIGRGDDGYLHAISIAGTGENKLVSVDSANSTMVNGTVLESSTETVMALNTVQGEMLIKLDSTTDMTGCRVVVAGMKVYVSVARGSDAYMHALSISDSNTTTDSYVSDVYTGNTGVTTTDYSTVPEGCTEVKGTPTDSSTADILYLKMDSGVMTVKIDESTDTAGGFVFTSGNQLTAYVYRGEDAVMHARKIVGKRAETTERGSATTTFTGTVSSNSTEDTLVVLTSGGTMKFKLDSTTTLGGGKALLKGKAITISATTGSDQYWHAANITVR